MLTWNPHRKLNPEVFKSTHHEHRPGPTVTMSWKHSVEDTNCAEELGNPLCRHTSRTQIETTHQEPGLAAL